jgi:1-phosphofructokinase family hexose kinase
LSDLVIVCVSGNPSIDKLFEVEQLVVGEIHRPVSFVALPGGKGIHVAQVATLLGAEAIVTGVLAGHAGRWVAERLAAEGVRMAFVWGSGETRSSLSVADRATGRLTEFYEDGVPLTARAWSELVDVVDGLLDGASWLALAGSVLAGADIDGYPRLIAAARSARVPVAVDSRGEALTRAIAAGPDLVKINLQEAEELLGAGIDSIADAHAAATEIRSRAGGDGHAVLITLGKRGMVLVDPGGAAWYGAVAARGNYPVGSGDAFLAGMLTALKAGNSWPQSTALGLGAAAANAEIPGAARLDPHRARELAATADIGPAP